MRLSKASAVALLAFALCFGMLGSAFGQAGTTGVYGDVKDQQGAVVVGATVTVVNLATGAERTTKTDATGAYQFRGLAPGLYRVKVDAAGFRSTVHDNVQLGVDTPARLPVALTVGAAAEVMEVVAAAATVNTIDGAIGNPISALQVQELPTEARNPVVLLSLQPGAIYLPGQEVTDPRSGSVSGSRADQGNVTLDGVDVNDPQFNTAFTSALRMTQDAIQEFKVTTTGFGAEQGRSSGAQVSLVTRSGTSELHGAGYWAHRNTVFSSNEYFNKLSQVSNGLPNEAPLLQKHVWGARLGGPVIKDRFFLFGNIENLREKSQESVLRDIPSNSFRDGFLIYECVDPSLCPATMVTGPSGRTYNIASGFRLLSNTELIQLDPLSLGVNTNALAYFNQYPLQNDSGNFDGINFAGFRFAAPLANQFWTYIARADFHVDRNANHKVFWRGNLQDDVTNSAPQFPGLAPNTQFTNNSKGFALGYTGVFGSNIVNNFRYGYTRLDVATVGLWDSNRVTFRFFDPFNALTSTNGRDAITHNFTNDLSLVKGSHTWQFGVNFRFTRIPQFTNAISFHQAIANGSWNQETGTRFIPGVCSHTDAAKATFCNSLPAAADQATFADAFTNILGVVNQVNARYNFNRDGSPLPAGEAVRRRFATNEYEFYAQDSWRLHPTFTLTLGVRYSLYTPVWETNGLQVAPTINTSEWFEIRRRAQDSGQSTGLGVPLLEFDLAGPANDKPHYYEYDKNNIAPRVAFAWMPNFQDGILGAITGRGRMNIRGGFGMVYDRVGHALAARFDTVGSFGLATLLRTGFGQNNEDTPGIRFVNETTMPPQTPPPPAPAPFPKQPALFNGAIEEGIDRGLRTPYTYLMNMAVSRELPWHMQMEMAYVGRVGVKLTTRRDLAMIANITDPASGLDYFGAVAELFRQMDALGISRTSPASAYTAITNVPYWQNLFPGFSGTVSGVPLTATQRIARAYSRFTNGSDVIWAMDQFCSIDFVTFGPCGTLGDFAYFTPQYDSLAALSSVGYSDYHALQATLRKRMSNGLLFDINYSFAKALDIGSNTERGSGFTTFGAGGVSGFLLDSWNPRKQYGRSDFDVRHNVNANWIFELPFGQGRRYALSGVANAIAGGWSLSGLWRWTSGFPFSVGNGRRWPTNWNLTGNAEQAFGATAYPATGTTHGAVQGQPSPFVDPAAAFDLFRFARPGEVGIRNTLDGDGYIAIDLGIGKDWTMPWLENHKLRFRWDIFNITNTASFDVATLTARRDQSASFGRYNRVTGACGVEGRAAGRCMQFGFRYEF